ncbi:potassium/sodium efflux P-type ATPase, fungal-type [Bacillus cereus ISP3191]|uniref:cation-translocating P-type ATPase n=1 Tax=Bacillus cereus group TaxID=86661 RepID=UPI0001DBF620|nr:cation-translocating P-type ATPase [Bacillus cereus]MDR4321394.1 cation-translocating P-type ATPase [Bacillus paranthracis]HDR4492776.1 cation-translocating P-type ATPase [Bacillus cereus biovar anthracis]ADK03193.1 cation-transporting ATPase A, P type [Bacillus cereus biovar anthracis str. CI]EJQ90566.1 potassium/sodium efflux P-type ATPase, fungal-type [Bacillus cereus ISP3191]HDR6236052.1 cation-translocating P-type ATPase [Bacillus cereus biovar anthracis]
MSNWYSKTKDQTLIDLETNEQHGLTEEIVNERLTQYGANELATKQKRSLWQRIFAQINDVLVYVLIIAALISAFVGEWADASIIALVVVLNAVIGVVQESKAEQALEALKKMATPKAIVKRDGELKEIPSEHVVPGDIVMLDAGRYIPCDLRLIETANLKVEESALTGESVPVDKDAICHPSMQSDEQVPLGDQKNMAFMSTLVTYGRGVGVAVETGMNSQIGKIATLLHEADDDMTPLQKSLAQVGKYLGFVAVAICIVMFLIGFLQGRDTLEMFMTAISLAVAAIPEGLPAIVSIVLAIGVQRMIKQNVIIRKLPAVEALGSVTIICSDKTGTLTQNKMTVTHFYSDNTYDQLERLNVNNDTQRLLLENMVLCNDASYNNESQTGDPTEIALLVAGSTFNMQKDHLEKIHERVNELPFDSDRKMMSTVHTYDESYYSMTKGAIDKLLPLCTHIFKNGKIEGLTEDDKNQILEAAEVMSQEALRVLSFAFKQYNSSDVDIDHLEENLIFIGLVGMIDPPRTEVKDSISECKKAGIRTVMITGDHKDTAFAIAKELGIAEEISEIMIGTELDNISDTELANKINHLHVFARVSPEHKVKIVKALRAKGNIVSMTGDGVNDAPSLKQADVGVAMGITGTDVAKGAADVVLTDDNFSSIVKAVEEGRNIYRNIKKSILFLLSCNFGEIIALFLAILLGWATPLRPIHILWVNLITDTLPALSLGVDPEDPDVMKEKPRHAKESLFSGSVPFLIFNGFVIGLLTLIAFIAGAKFYTGDTNLFPLFPERIDEDALLHAQTMAFVVLSFSQLVHSFNLRSRTKSIFSIGIFTNKYLVFSLLIGVLMQVCIISIPPLANIFGVHALTMRDWGFVLLLSIIPLVVSEFIKLVKRN